LYLFIVGFQYNYSVHPGGNRCPSGALPARASSVWINGSDIFVTDDIYANETISLLCLLTCKLAVPGSILLTKRRCFVLVMGRRQVRLWGGMKLSTAKLHPLMDIRMETP
jgi:hypothetical protein